MGIAGAIILMRLFSLVSANPPSQQDYGLCSQIYVMHQYCTSQLNPASTVLSHRPVQQPRVGKAGPRGPRGIVNYTAVEEKMAEMFSDWEAKMEEKFMVLKSAADQEMKNIKADIENKTKEREASLQDNFRSWKSFSESEMNRMTANLTDKANALEESIEGKFTRWKLQKDLEMRRMKAEIKNKTDEWQGLKDSLAEQKNSLDSEMNEMRNDIKNMTNEIQSLKTMSIPRGCEEAGKTDGVVGVQRVGKLYQVYCDMSTDGGKWTVFQRRVDGSVDFYRTWEEYASGFGNPSGEFWLGLEAIHQLTQDGDYELRVDLTDWDGSKAYAKYRTFSISGRSDDYRLTVGGYSGTAGDSMSYSSGHGFSAKDKDLDTSSYNCASYYAKAAWWFANCAHSSLNGRYNDTSGSYNGILWYYWKSRWSYSLKGSEMKFRKK